MVLHQRVAETTHVPRQTKPHLNGTQPNGKFEYHGQIDDEQRRRVLRGALQSYYDVRSDSGDTVIDTNRGWSAKMSLLSDLWPDARMVACVRDPGKILASFERIFQSRTIDPSRMFSYSATENVYSRAERLMASEGSFGGAFNAFKEAFYGNHTDRLLVVRYDTLVEEPQRTIEALYEHLKLRHFEHDFGDVHFDGGEYDRTIGLPGLHDVDGPIVKKEHPPIMPPDLLDRCKDLDFWNKPELNLRGVTIL